MRNDRHPVALGAVLLAALLASRGAAAQGRASPHQNLGAMECTDCHRTTNWRDVSFDHRRTTFQLLGQHQTVPCTGCHDVRNFQGAVRACGTCHADPHRGDAGPDCERCHSETGWRQVGALEAHARTRLPDLGVHAALRCEDCHRQTGAQQFTGAVSPCIACHQRTYDATANPQHRTLGFSSRCEICHQFATWQFALFAEHDAIFGIYSGSHAGVWRDCSTCHANASDYRIYTCTTCHTQAPSDRTHQGIPGYTWESTACLGCHPNGRGGDLSFHGSLFPIFSGAHGGAWSACTDCHVDPSSRRVFSCMTGSCHPQTPIDASHAGITGYQYVAAQCYSCHPDGTRGSFAQHDAIFPITTGTHAGRWSSCAACHTDPASRQVFSCTTGGCHVQTATDPAHAGIPGYQYVSAQCLSCHPDGTRGTFAQHDAIFPIFSGTHAGRWSSCATCHTNPASRSVFTCTGSGCHQQAEMDNHHSGITGYGPDPASCLRCHPNGRKPVAPGLRLEPPARRPGGIRRP